MNLGKPGFSLLRYFSSSDLETSLESWPNCAILRMLFKLIEYLC